MAAIRVFSPLGLVAIAVVIAVVILGVSGGKSAGGKGGGFFKKQGVAWAITIVMIIAAIGIGYDKANASTVPEPMPPTYAPVPSVAPPTAAPPAPSAVSYVWDNAQVLSDQTERVLNQRNDRLWERYQASVGVVTCNYGGDDLYGYAMQCAEDMGLGGYDMIVVLDIQGDNYWLLQGNDIRGDFTDNDCSNYAYDYMEDDFAWGLYDDAVLDLTEALEVWYGNYYR